MGRLRFAPRIGFAILAALSLPLAAENWVPVASTGNSVMIEEDTRLSDLPIIQQQVFLPDQDQDVKLTSIIQLFPVDPGRLRVRRARKAQGRATASCLTPRGQRSLGSGKVRGDQNGNLVFTREVPASHDCDLYLVQWQFLKNLLIPEGTSVDARTAVELVDSGADPGCFSANGLCLQDDRFQAEVDWTDFTGGSGSGVAFPRTDDSGTFFFFNPDNTELVLKVIDGCRFNDHYWVFFGATTNVEFGLTVTDTQTGQSRVYENPLAAAAPAIQDTQAFATCP